MISLIPVIEFEPARYTRALRSSPAVALNEDPQAWDAYWRTSLSDAGLDELSPLFPGSWYVPIAQLVCPATLRVLLTLSSENIADEEELAPLPGGYVLSSAEGIITPGCCSDFSTLWNWRSAALSGTPEWEMVWIGHPWIYVSADGDTLHCSHPAEEPPAPGAAPLLSIPRHSLLAGIDTAKRDLDALTARLHPIIDEQASCSDPASMLRILIWGHEDTLKDERR